MDNTKLVLAIAVAIYTGAVVAIGLWKSRQTRGADSDMENVAESENEYYLAGRSLNAWLAAFSGAASAESAWVLLGLIGTAYAGGISALWLIPGCLAGYLFNWLAIGPRLRQAAEETGSVTVPEVLARLHPELGRPIRLVSGLIILVFMTAYVSAQFNAVGTALGSMFSTPYIMGVLIGLAIVFTYVITGGFRASVWTDLIQALMMVSVLVVLPIAGLLFYDGSLSEALAGAPNLFDPLGGTAGFAALGFVVGWVGIGLAYPGQPHVVTRFIATRNERELRRAGIIATVWSTLVFTGAIATGIVARAWMPGLDNAEQALPEFAMAFLPAPVAGLILAAVLAAICSTADSQLLIASSTVSRDLLESRWPVNRQTNHRRRNQFILVVLGVLAAAFAATENRVIFTFVLYAWGVLGASIGTALIGSLFWTRTSGFGVLAGMIGGLLTAVIWRSIPTLSGAVYELIPAFFVGLALTLLVAPRPEGSPATRQTASISEETG